MLRRTATYHEFLDEAGRRFVVRLNVGQPVAMVQFGPVSERVDWCAEWGTYRPQSEQTAERIVARFLERHERRQGLDKANDELVALNRQPSRKEPVDVHERQLPVSDRA